MNADREIVDRIRSAADIVQTVSEYVPLRKAGRRHVGLCPFHAEKTPSFSVDEQKQLFYCFGCGAGGDIFKFLMLHEKLEFPEALKLLAEKHGIEIPQTGQREAAPRGLKDRLLEANALAAGYYRAALAHSVDGRAGREYLGKRGIAQQTIDRLGIGYAPRSWDGLRSHLMGRGYSPAELATSGLVVPRADGSGSYDRFRERIIFPIVSAGGKVVGFGGRTIAAPGEQTSEPKYMNSPETPVFSKSDTLYGLYAAREALKKEGFAILVEGYLDFASLFEAGIENVVASLGTAFTEGHARLLARYVDAVVVNFDTDAAGKAAALRSLVPLAARGLKVRVLQLPAGEDPDLFVRRAGADGYREALGSAPAYMDYVISESTSDKDMRSPESQVNALNQILPHLAAIESPIERSRYVPILADRLSVEDSLILGELSRAVRGRKSAVAPPPVRRDEPKISESEAGLVRILIENPLVREDLLPLLGEGKLDGLSAGPIFSEIREMAAHNEPLDYAALSTRLTDGGAMEMLGRIAMRTDPPGGLAEGRACLATLERERLAVERKRLQNRIEAASDAASIQGLLSRKIEISRRIDELS